jgi:hypothetical protein
MRDRNRETQQQDQRERDVRELPKPEGLQQESSQGLCSLTWGLLRHAVLL